jgi:hypothetical protein
MILTIDTRIRFAQPNDLNFVIKSYLESYRESLASVSNAIYYENQQKLFKSLLLKSKTIVLCNPLDEDQVFAFLVYQEPNIVHYAFTKKTYKRLGFANHLIRSSLGSGPLIHSHRNHTHSYFKNYEITYNPYLAL